MTEYPLQFDGGSRTPLRNLQAYKEDVRAHGSAHQWKAPKVPFPN